MNDIDISALNAIRKAGADFSFSNTLVDSVNNIQFADSINNAHESTNACDNSMANILSSVGDQLGSRIYDEILNYIDNVGNVDICKIKALQTMANVLGISYIAFAVINDMPQEIQDIMNVMSMSPEYLLNSKKTYSLLTSYISSNGLSNIEPNIQESVLNDLSDLSAGYADDNQLSSDISASVAPYISIEKLDNIVRSMYKTQIDSVLLSSFYSNFRDGQPNLSTNIISCQTEGYKTYFTYMNNEHQILVRAQNYTDEIQRLKKYYNIPFFDESKEADNLELGVTQTKDYTVHELEIIDIEMKWRASAFNASDPTSRYAYYKAQNVQKYIDFVESMYTIDNISVLQIYDIDNDYILFKNGSRAQLLSAETMNGDNLSVDSNMISSAVDQLAVITQYIRELRQKIKTQAQKNAMKGTFLFLNFIINEYIKENVLTDKKYAVSNVDPMHVNTETQLVEYIDPTNYFNISTDVDLSAESYFGGQQLGTMKNSLNPRYWEADNSIPAVVPADNTNIFAGPKTVNSKSTAFSEQAISSFYIEMMNNQLGDSSLSDVSSTHSHLLTFLSSIFDVGADKTYRDAEGNLCCTVDLSKYEKMRTKTFDEISSILLCTELSIDNAKLSTDEVISSYENDIILSIDKNTASATYELSVLSSQFENTLSNYQTSATSSIVNLCSEYDVGQISNYFDIYYKMQITSLSEYQLNQLSSNTLNSLTSQICSDFETKKLSICNEYSSNVTDISSKLSTYIQQLCSDFSDFYANEYSAFSQTSSDLCSQAYALSSEKMQELSVFRETSTSALSLYKNQLYKQYIGLSVGDTPYYYYSNTVHPSYQIHPFLSSFIEVYDYTYAIENMPTLAEETMFELLSKNLDSYIDEFGYLLSVWNNPLNRNSDYLTHYERVPHLDANNQNNKLFGYDGLFYPEAVDELISAYENTTYDNLKSFVDKWYNGLNISEKQQERIIAQLSCFKDMIIDVSKNKTYDIYRYGRDIYGNMFILLKDYNLSSTTVDEVQNILETVKKDSPGMLWTRMKNHPIAFPAYINGDLSAYSQIDYNESYSNTILRHAVDYSEQSKLPKLPCIYDFFMSQDKQQIELFTNIQDDNVEKYFVMIAGIDQQYNYNKDIDRYQLFLTTVAQKNSSQDEGDPLLANEHFAGFVNYEYSIGYITLQQNESKTGKITAKQKIFTDVNVVNMIKDNLDIVIIDDDDSTIHTDDIKFDSCNEKLYFSYVSAYQPSPLSTYFNTFVSADVTYHSLSSSIDIFADNCIVVKQVNVGKYNLTNEYTKCYLPFTDMGFLPLLGENMLQDNHKTTEMYNSTFEMMKKYSIVKMQPILDKNDKGIDYIYCLEYPRLYENFQTDLCALSDISQTYAEVNSLKDISVYCYNDLHSFEEGYKDLHEKIYEPYTMRNFIADKDKDVQIKLDESYTRIKAIKSSNYLRNMIPWLVKGEVPYSCVSPGGNDMGNLTVEVSNQAIFKLVESDQHAISVSWIMHNNGQIKIDFNAQYYNKQINKNLPNYYNYQHTFLNLDYPGAAGWLKIYNDNISNAIDENDFNKYEYCDNTYYIKNISDTKPKFILSAMNYEIPTIDVTLLKAEDLNSDVSCIPLVVQPPELLDVDEGISSVVVLDVEKIIGERSYGNSI